MVSDATNPLPKKNELLRTFIPDLFPRYQIPNNTGKRHQLYFDL